MDWASLAGIVLALAGILLGHRLEGGHFGALVQPAAFCIVFIGTVGAVMLQSGMTSFIQGIRLARWVFQPPRHDQAALMQQMQFWGRKARREGLLTLETLLKEARDPFTAKGLRLAVDGVDVATLRSIMDVEINTYERRQRQAARIWDAAGGYSPTIGILGAVLGLIHVMERLSDPGTLGPGIAVAFVATIYGVGFANLLFLPIGSKLKTLISDEVARMEMLADAFCPIAEGANANVLEEQLTAYR
ncbi:chemotaxis protein MotA [Noviherbaspirillum humi]|uniref:Chemotaxis protein MotA n=1 Tax=Noviherbaspirillum humi TaxID=1688639 RepID=A0A239FX07_9BURK|nr:flagellar motor protein [Noviherbaspirillum humi]SNS60752.1 chemotaxis protein MotA [Noviherbaspirillum humi]